MTETTTIIVNPLGLHARPAAQLVKLANTFASDIELLKDGVPVNGKSIMGVMILAAECGSAITIRASGADEGAAVAALSELVRSGFGES
jgi:phosphocarrier protein HPr